ncbi:CRISPR-associated protein, Csh2 family [Caminicella sporogenes DSM 14501]|uniref:CRISPR-associated protein, Csh2 family n=1 Tax=Caminicella sporogenes DSM 14501 TaxID=1121266 RepID=A0A1M6QEF5_9FIRM|nr:type I-B CRISPR-associated protein Cas7/Csh2 [Caminicella sporogenes]SHK18500.1 CRISPR-associated protein, Csh2 family [Caminicella sporogenes DSM 14501]
MINRSEIIFLYDIKDNNPNGDPIDQNKPRIDEETGINIVTDVRLKRTIRDYLYDYLGKEIFVREIRNEQGKVQDGKIRAKDFGKKKEDIIQNILQQCIDVRLFGATIPLDKDSVTFTGPVQFTMGRSLHKVEIKRIKGTGAFASGQNKDNKTFREEFILPYSLIGFYGIINEKAAEATKLTKEDVKLLIEAIWNGTKNLISRSKIGQVPRLLVKVNYKEKYYHIGDLLKTMRIESDKEDEQIRNVEDFILNIDDFIKILKENKDKIEDVEIKVDSRLNMSVDIFKVLEEVGIKVNKLII